LEPLSPRLLLLRSYGFSPIDSRLPRQDLKHQGCQAKQQQDWQQQRKPAAGRMYAAAGFVVGGSYVAHATGF